MLLYTAPAFLNAFGHAFCEGKTVSVVPHRLGGRVWNLPTLENGNPITTWEFVDFYEAADLTPNDTLPRVPHLPRVSLGDITTAEWDEHYHGAFYESAPFVRWAEFQGDWNAYETYVNGNRGRLFKDSRRRIRKLEAEMGKMVFHAIDNNPESFKALLAWKSAQFTYAKGVFADPQNVAFLQHMLDSGFAVLSTLSAGDQLLAGHIGVLLDGHHYSWVMGYNPDHHAYGAGRLLVEELLRLSMQRGDHTYDFMLGGEDFKWWYGTHCRRIAPLGGINKNTVKFQVKKALARHPKARQTVQKVYQKLKG